MKVHQVYSCEVCGTEYLTEAAAAFCESRPTFPRPCEIGAVVKVRPRYSDAEEDRTVIALTAEQPLWLGVVGIDTPEHLAHIQRLIAEDDNPDASYHCWRVALNEPVRWSKDEDSYSIYRTVDSRGVSETLGHQ